jgi:hypothetical protein
MCSNVKVLLASVAGSLLLACLAAVAPSYAATAPAGHVKQKRDFLVRALAAEVASQGYPQTFAEMLERGSTKALAASVAADNAAYFNLRTPMPPPPEGEEIACGCAKVKVKPPEVSIEITAGESRKETFTYTNAEPAGGVVWHPGRDGAVLLESPRGGATSVVTDKCLHSVVNPTESCKVEIEIKTTKKGVYEEVFSIQCGPGADMEIIAN